MPRRARRFVLYALIPLIFSLPALGASRPDCDRELTLSEVSAPEIARSVAATTEKELRRNGMRGREARGYAILIGTMVASAAATTYASASLPPNLQFISQFLGQLSTLGVFVFGAPIWEPLSSAFRKLAFGVRGVGGTGAGGSPDPGFEELWRRTQENYSLNEQMSRNVITQFLVSVRQNFYEAHRAANSDNSNYAADQIAEAAFRLRVLFREIEPDDLAVAAAVRTAFTNHVTVNQDFILIVEQRVRDLDPGYSEAENYYAEIIRVWLGPIAPL